MLTPGAVSGATAAGPAPTDYAHHDDPQLLADDAGAVALQLPTLDEQRQKILKEKRRDLLVQLPVGPPPALAPPTLLAPPAALPPPLRKEKENLDARNFHGGAAK